MPDKTSCCCLVSIPLRCLPFGYTEDQYVMDKFKLKLMVEIETMRGKGVTMFMTGLNRGTELWGAEIILNLKRAYPGQDIHLVAVIPCADLTAHWPSPDKKRFSAVLSSADEVITLQSRYSPRCVLRSIRYIIDHSAHMIAVTGGEPGDIRFAVDYAAQNHLDIVAIRPREYVR